MADEGSVDHCFKNILEVVKHLKAYGWKVGKSIAYQHRNDGKIRPRADGLFHKKDVEKYARTFLRRFDTGFSVSDSKDSSQQEKQAAETEKIKAQARHWSMKASILEGRYVEKGLFERELARRAAVFKNDIENFCRSQAPGIINLVAGDAAKAPDLIDHMLAQAENWLGRYAEEKEFRLPAPQPEEDVDDAVDDLEPEGQRAKQRKFYRGPRVKPEASADAPAGGLLADGDEDEDEAGMNV